MCRDAPEKMEISQGLHEPSFFSFFLHKSLGIALTTYRDLST